MIETRVEGGQRGTGGVGGAGEVREADGGEHVEGRVQCRGEQCRRVRGVQKVLSLRGRVVRLERRVEQLRGQVVGGLVNGEERKVVEPGRR